MTSDKRGDAVGEKWSDEFAKHRRDFDVAAERLKVRAELKSAHEEEPDTGVIVMRAEQRVAERSDSVPAPAKGITAVLGGVKTWQHVVALGILVAALVFVAWLKSR